MFIREESNPQYDQAVLILAEKQGISTTFVHTAKDLFKKMSKDSNLHNDMKFCIMQSQFSSKIAKWIHDIKMILHEFPIF